MALFPAPTKEDREQSGESAAEKVRVKILAALKKERVTYSRVAKKVSKKLDATETKTHYDKEAGKWKYSRPLQAHAVQLRAAEFAAELLEMKSSKFEVEHSGSVTLKMTDEDRALVRVLVDQALTKM